MKMKIFDVVVVGGGVGGVAAALSVRREGKSVVLIEKGSILGGLSTTGLINWFEPLCDGKGHQLIFSICDELFRLATKYEYNTFDNKWEEKNARMVSFFDHNLFALSLNKLLVDEGVEILYETAVTDVNVNNDLVSSVEVETVEGKNIINGCSFVDASGSAVIFRNAKIPCRNGINYLVYATTTLKNGVGKPTFQYTGAFPDGSNQIGGARTYSGLKDEDVNEFLIQGQLHCLDEYEKRIIKDISTIPSMPQFRKIASIEGEYCLTKNDLFKHHDDSIGAFGAFNHPGDTYEIPFGCLYSKAIKNLFAAGRIISSDDEGWEVIRVIPVAILTGEASGLAASLYADNSLDIETLQTKLIKRGNKLHF